MEDLKLFTLHCTLVKNAYLFHDTIRANILFGKPDATEAEMIAAAKEARCHDFIMALPDGYDTYISEENSQLSVGEKQLLVLARAVLADPRILILDEATSNMDTRTEALVTCAMESMMEGRTTFIIAHRLFTIRNADKIVVINQGEIIETGSHNELMEIENGAYKALYNAQFKSSAKKDDAPSSGNMTSNA